MVGLKGNFDVSFTGLNANLKEHRFPAKFNIHRHVIHSKGMGTPMLQFLLEVWLQWIGLGMPISFDL